MSVFSSNPLRAMERLSLHLESQFKVWLFIWGVKAEKVSVKAITWQGDSNQPFIQRKPWGEIDEGKAVRALDSFVYTELPKYSLCVNRMPDTVWEFSPSNERKIRLYPQGACTLVERLPASQAVLQNQLSGGVCAGENGEEICHLTSAQDSSAAWNRAPLPFREGFSLRPAVTL